LRGSGEFFDSKPAGITARGWAKFCRD